jgi:hypothetical protein
MTMAGVEVDKASGPKDLRSKETGEHYNAAVDIMALPGMLGSHQAFWRPQETQATLPKWQQQ